MTLRCRRHPDLKPEKMWWEEKRIFFLLLFALLVLVVAVLIGIYHVAGSESSLEDFGIDRILSRRDRNGNGIDDYTDFLLGARKDAKNHPKYDDRYWAEGYPPDDIGVCTDVIWRSFRNAGYSLRDMVDRDVELFPEDYPNVTVRDRNIDFRRVKNLRVFFQKYAVSLTVDPEDLSAWQPGDIVIFGDNTHIGMISDRRNRRNGRAYVIHNGGQRNREEDYLSVAKPVAHYRFDAAAIPESVLVSWEDPE